MKLTYKLISGLVVVVAVVAGGYYAWHSHAARSGLANLSADTKLTDSQVAELVSDISKFLVVPAGEKPSVVVIHDVQQLAAQQPFYKDAKDGDLLVLYSTRAIIYDAGTNKLVNVGPIVRNDAPAAGASPVASESATVAPTASPVTAKPITVDVRNGTSTAGLAGAVASELKKNKLFTIGTVGDAKGSYKETIVVDLTKDEGKAAAVAALAKQLGATVVTKLPTGESSTSADALVIVGK